MATIDKARLNALAAKLRAARSPESNTQTIPTIQSIQPSAIQTDRHGNLITYNEKQQEFIKLSSSGQSCVLIGPAGTGKTTCMKGSTLALIENGIIGTLDSLGHKHLRSGSPGVAICAYTRRATANIRKNVSDDLKDNCITIHKLLEYSPVYYETIDPVTSEPKTTMRFEPTRNRNNPLPATLKTIIFEESSMIGTDLYQEVIDACPHNPQLIFLGDIQQLPPVFGPAILGFKLLTLPVVELTEVYRQALESPIISLAHRILSGNGIPVGEFEKWKFPGKLTLRPWKKKISDIDALNTTGMVFTGNKLTQTDPAKQATGFHEAGLYDPEQDMILLPFNKSFGTLELNKIIANYLAKTNGRVTHEIVSGFIKHYLSIGDKVLYEKEDAVVIDIEPNPGYAGSMNYLPASETLDYWGHDPILRKTEQEASDDSVDFLLSQVAGSDEDRVHKASHIVTLKMMDSDVFIKLDKASELNSLMLGYCLTVHKSQGSEWRRVFFILHQSHATMIQRELLYTAVTRAKEELYIICEPESFVKGIASQKVKGNTLAEKAEYFKGKADREGEPG